MDNAKKTLDDSAAVVKQQAAVDSPHSGQEAKSISSADLEKTVTAIFLIENPAERDREIARQFTGKLFTVTGPIASIGDREGSYILSFGGMLQIRCDANTYRDQIAALKEGQEVTLHIRGAEVSHAPIAELLGFETSLK